MKNIGIIGLGDMGMGIARNLLKSGFNVRGFDLDEERLNHFISEGGIRGKSCTQVGENSDIVFIMVLHGEQAKSVVLGDSGVAAQMKSGSIIIITATIGRNAVLEIEKGIADKGLKLVDSPVSGGRGGAEAGTLTLMAATDDETFLACTDVLNAIAKNINHVGKDVGQGQTVKHTLSALTGTCYVGIFEALVLGANVVTMREVPAGGFVRGEAVRLVTVGDELFVRTDGDGVVGDHLGDLPG